MKKTNSLREIIKKTTQSAGLDTKKAGQLLAHLTDKATPMAKTGWAETKRQFQSAKDKALPVAITAIEQLSDKFGETFSTLSQDQLLAWFGKITQSPATVYDKALDAVYANTNVGGGNHRLFDKSHDLMNAWKKVADAKPDDSFAQEVAGFADAIWKDVTTIKGLPFMSLEKATFTEWAEKISNAIPGVSKEYLYDLCSYDALEVFSATLGVVSAIFALKKEDTAQLAEILGVMGINAILSANPIAGIVTVAITGYSYFYKKHRLDGRSLFKGGAITVVSATVFGVLGLPFLIELVIVMVVTNVIRKQVLDNEQFTAFVQSYMANAAKSGSSALRSAALNLAESLTRFADPKKKVS